MLLEAQRDFIIQQSIQQLNDLYPNDYTQQILYLHGKGLIQEVQTAHTIHTPAGGIPSFIPYTALKVFNAIQAMDVNQLINLADILEIRLAYYE